MSLLKLPYTIAGQWVTGITLVAFFIAGCEGVDVVLPPLDGGGNGDLFGVIVNTDPTQDLIGGVRLRSGESVYSFGTWTPDGNIGEVNSVVYQNAAGQTATLYFEDGRPARAIGFDGSVLEITYTQANAQRLAGTATFTPADGSAPGSMAFDIDLQKTAAEIAALVEDLTGLQVSAQPPPEKPEITADPDTAKTVGAAVEVKSSVVLVLVPVVLAVTGFTITLVMSQIMEGFVQAGNALVIAALSPIILMGNLMRAAMGLPLVTIDYGSGAPNINIPRPD